MAQNKRQISADLTPHQNNKQWETLKLRNIKTRYPMKNWDLRPLERESTSSTWRELWTGKNLRLWRVKSTPWSCTCLRTGLLTAAWWSTKTWPCKWLMTWSLDSSLAAALTGNSLASKDLRNSMRMEWHVSAVNWTWWRSWRLSASVNSCTAVTSTNKRNYLCRCNANALFPQTVLK